jgi:THO complex subunit 4
MSIAYDTMPPRNPRRATSAPSLINRIQKPPLLDRLSRDDAHVKTPSAPFVFSLALSFHG